MKDAIQLLEIRLGESYLQGRGGAYLYRDIVVRFS